jgi:predicted metalloprotease with PDZ domain
MQQSGVQPRFEGQGMGSMGKRAALAPVALAGVVAGAVAHAALPAPADTPWPGTLALSVDATDLDHRIFRVHEQIPVAPGPLTLLYPQWLPGHHSPGGPIDKLAGLVVSAGGQRVAWTRDPVDVYAFHVEVPAGATRLDVDFDYLSPQEPAQGRIVSTRAMLNLQWNAVVLYPAGHDAGRITVEAGVKLPSGWRFGTALETAGEGGGMVRFKPVPLDVLVDSPIFAGAHFRRVELAGGPAPVHLDIVADEAKDLEIRPDQLQAHVDLVEQARRLFGSHHYDHYDFLLALTDELGGIGLEHHRSSENSADPGYFTDWDKQAPRRDLLAHEYTHSWNGKFRRPADLATPNFNVPMQGSLLWVYEGQTQYWGFVLAARAGLWTREQAMDAIALVAARYTDDRPGFGWRNVQDTTNDPVVASRRSLPYRSYQMSEDYYSAGQLVWLAVDAKLRELTRDQRSLDDFARAFFGVDDGRWTVEPYTFDDVVAALDGVSAWDWATFLRQRIDALAPPLDGLPASGWKLAYTDAPGAFQRINEANRKSIDHSASIGLTVGSKDGRISDVRWDGPAFRAGVASGEILVAVDGRAFTPARLRDAIAAARERSTPIQLLLKREDEYRMLPVDYHGGLRYPHLERIPGTPDRLGAILAPRR